MVNLIGVAPSSSSSSMCLDFESRRAKLIQQRHLRELNVTGKVGKNGARSLVRYGASRTGS